MSTITALGSADGGTWHTGRHRLDGSHQSEHATARRRPTSSVSTTGTTGTGGLPERFENPGLPRTCTGWPTTSEAGRRAERQVAALFGLSMLATVLFIVAYFAIDRTGDLPARDRQRQRPQHRPRRDDGLSLCPHRRRCGPLGRKTLMPDDEIVEERHEQRSDDASRGEARRPHPRRRREGPARSSTADQVLLGAVAPRPVRAALRRPGGRLARQPDDGRRGARPDHLGRAARQDADRA